MNLCVAQTIKRKVRWSYDDGQVVPARQNLKGHGLIPTISVPTPVSNLIVPVLCNFANNFVQNYEVFRVVFHQKELTYFGKFRGQGGSCLLLRT